MRTSKLIKLNERIFVAGSNGMVGSSVCRLLKSSGYGKKENGGIILAPTKKELNLLDTESVKEWFKINKPTIVILAAAKVGGIYANSKYPADFIFENLKIQTNVVESAWKSKVKRFVFLGSSCVYPKYADQPIKEESLLTGTLESTNEWYAISKISGIKLCQALRTQYNFDSIILMPTNLYGTGDNYHPQNSHVMPALIRKFCNAIKFTQNEVKCWGTGKALREFMHVDDLSRAIIFSLENWNPDYIETNNIEDKNSYALLNVGTGIDISIKDLVKKIAHKLNYKGEIIWDPKMPDGTPRKLLNTDKINKMGWKPKISLDEGIDRTINEFLKLDKKLI